MKVFVYFNLHRKCWSVKAMEGPDKGRVIQHRSSLTLRDCAYKVSEAGRQRVLATRRKAVHAGIVGTLVDENPQGGNVKAVTYNPYKGPDFVTRDDGQPIKVSRFAALFFDRSVFAFI